jgi:crossover junction endodeoxyribonuclease RusA
MKPVISNSTGRAIVIPTSPKRLAEWTRTVEETAWIAMHHRPKFERVVMLYARFSLNRPRGVPVSELVPRGMPDADKLARAVGDALSGIVYTDDAQIADIRSGKRYVGGIGGAPVQGAEIIVWEPTLDDLR